jgi:signal transduction histidine kinase
VVFVANTISPNIPQGWWDLPGAIGVGIAVPVACGIAIFQHGLYELDVVISKTVVYGVLAAFFAAVYLALVVGIGTLVGSTHNAVLTVLAAALIALAFNPVRERAKHLANRVVYGRRATPYEVLSEFAERASATYSTEDVLPQMAVLVAQGTGARTARVWLRIGDALRVAAAHPLDLEEMPPITLVEEEMPDVPRADVAFPVRHQGEILGAITVEMPPSEPPTPEQERLVRDVASQAGLALRNVRLAEELRINLEELRASRQRIVTAQDARAKALERNLHDGAQQQLVALVVKLGLAERLVDRDAEQVRSMLAELRDEAQDALQNLRDLARGIYPPLLADQGLVAALEAHARKLPFHVSVAGDGVGRLPPEVEAGVYFCCLEALQNASKYANPAQVRVTLTLAPGGLAFEVQDDGMGFDPASAPTGAGRQNMADRIAALGGTLVVQSAPGRGTTVTGRLPLDAPPLETPDPEIRAALTP